MTLRTGELAPGRDPRINVATVVTRCIAGAGGVALRGMLELDPERYRLTLVTGEGGPLTEQAEAAGIRVLLEPDLVAPIAPRQDAEELRSLTRLFAKESFDVVHTHSAKAGAIGRAAAHRAGVPRIVHTYHGFPFHEFQSPWRRAAYVAVERRLARFTDVVLAIGSGVATEALRRGLAHPSTLRTVTPVVDTRTVPQDPASRARARALLGLDPDTVVVGTVGRLDYQKAPEHFVEAIARMHRRVQAVWVGSGPQMEEMRALVERTGLAGRVHLIGERRDVPDLLPAFDVFARASRYEGLPCAVVEAMRCGLPVVATMVNSVPDLVIPGVSGVLVPPGRPEMLAEALDGLLADPGGAARMAEAGRALAGLAYDPASLGRILDEVYRGTAGAAVVEMATAQREAG